MKRVLSLCALAVLLVTVAAVPVFAGSAKARVPFAFVVGDVSLQAGDYQIDPVGLSGVFALTTREGKRIMVMTRANGAAVGDTSRLLFVRQGSGYALAEIRMAGHGVTGILPVKTQSPYQVAVVLK